MNYEFAFRPYGHLFNTTSSYDQQVRVDVENWVEQHRPGAKLDIRVNPSDPSEIAVTSELPIEQVMTAREAWVGVMIFAGPALLLIWIGRLLHL